VLIINTLKQNIKETVSIPMPMQNNIKSESIVPINAFWCPIKNDPVLDGCYMNGTITCVQCYCNHVFFANKEIWGITVDSSYQEEMYWEGYR